MDLAKTKNAVALVIELDTPGGLLESTRRMTRDILNSPIPVIVWVGP
ncbi:MAG: nodulation protein NfeD, partial [Chloroflexi bacterium]|nr:nodulation protein NfeD [Chloroflexota bacterium]